MAKNFNLHIKNSQLAKALNVGKDSPESSQAKAPAAAAKAKVAPTPPVSSAHATKEAPPKIVRKATALPKSFVDMKPPVEAARPEPVVQEQPREEVIEPVPPQVVTAPSTHAPSSTPASKPPVSKTTPAEGVKPASTTEEEARNLKALPEVKKKETPWAPVKKPEQKSRFDSRDRQGLSEFEEGQWRRRRPHRRHKDLYRKEEPVIRPKSLHIKLPIMIKDLAQEMKLKASELISKLFMQGVITTLNDYLDDETTIQLLGAEFNCEITIDTSEEQRLRITNKSIAEEIASIPEEQIFNRPPVVAFMGHVDHGKTSLIDAIRSSNLAAGEAGAITQHIGAFRCHSKSGDLTVLDTPGHEAFSEMRARGANVTDIVILVVAGDEGIMAQTDEAIRQAREANVPIVVALNKSDRPSFNPDQVYRQLAERDLLPEAWGGKIITVNCSAKTGEGIADLLEMSLLQAEVLELRASPAMRARGTVLESSLSAGFGPIATVLVQNGTLKKGDALVFDDESGRVKTMHDEYGKEMLAAGPSCPVKITGLSGLPEAGSEFIVVGSEKEAKKLIEERQAGKKRAELKHIKKDQIENILMRNQELAKKKVLNLILKADVQGSLEALQTSLKKIPNDKVELNIISADVGRISESDIERASTSNAPIIAFHTDLAGGVEDLVKRLKIDIRKHDIIYHLISDIKALMTLQLDKIREEHEAGEAEVRAVFKSSGLGNIAGCQVSEGIIKRSHRVKLVRKGAVVWEGEIASLKRVKEDVKEIQKGFECGIVLKDMSNVQVGDLIKTFEIVYREQEL